MPNHSTDLSQLFESLSEGLKPHLEKLSEYLKENEEELNSPFRALEAAMPELACALGPYLVSVAKQVELVDCPASGRIAVKVINHLGDEAMKVFRV